MMTAADSPFARRLAAVGLLVALLGGVALFGVLPLAGQFNDMDRKIAEREALLADVQRVAARRAELVAARQALAENLASGRRFLEGDSTELIAAGLQAQVKALTDRDDATLDSTQALISDDDSGFRKVALRVSMTATTPALQDILYALETATPYLFVDNVELRSASLRGQAGAGREADLLQVRFDLFGFVSTNGGQT